MAPSKAQALVSRSPWRPPSAARVARVRDRLREIYGIPRMAPHGRPLDELVLTVLSQSTNDRNRDVAFLRLRERFARAGGADASGAVRRATDRPSGERGAGGAGGPARSGQVRSGPGRRGGERGTDGAAAPGHSPSAIDWDAVLAAPVSEIEQAIRPGGISKVKSARIQAILAAIEASAHEERDPLSLEWMRAAPVAQSRDYLCGLPGVGRKTAACVLLFSYGLRDVPVDTHVSRVGMRLRLLEPHAPFERLHDQMLALTPPGQELELHVNLLRHGRRTCFARKPACEACALARMCPSRGML